jgi:hypothetical protein
MRSHCQHNRLILALLLLLAAFPLLPAQADTSAADTSADAPPEIVTEMVEAEPVEEGLPIQEPSAGGEEVSGAAAETIEEEPVIAPAAAAGSNAAVTRAGLARDMDEILESEAITWAQAARFVLPAAGFAADNASTAFEMANSRAWLPKNAEYSGAVDFGGLSFLLMKAFDIPGGLMYRFFPGARYAYRELVYRGVLHGQHDPARKVSGFWLITLVATAIQISGVEE